MVELLKGEKELLTKRLTDSEKELRELSGRACVDAERMELQLQSQSEQIVKVNICKYGYVHTVKYVFMYAFCIYISIRTHIHICSHLFFAAKCWQR
jgi:hypothetical protein